MNRIYRFDEVDPVVWRQVRRIRATDDLWKLLQQTARYLELSVLISWPAGVLESECPGFPAPVVEVFIPQTTSQRKLSYFGYLLMGWEAAHLED